MSVTTEKQVNNLDNKLHRKFDQENTPLETTYTALPLESNSASLVNRKTIPKN